MQFRRLAGDVDADLGMASTAAGLTVAGGCCG
jgi:hypothetical protein